jgi:dihydroneopterin aldolase
MNPYLATVDMSGFVAALEPLIVSLIKKHNERDDDEAVISDRIMVAAVEKFIESSDFHYLIEDAVNSQVEELVSDAIRNTSVRIEVD